MAGGPLVKGFHRKSDQLRGRVNAQLGANVLAMIVDGKYAQVERRGDLLAGFTLTDEL